MTPACQDELLASILHACNQYETIHHALLKARQHISQLSQTVNTLSERQGLGQNVRALDCHNEIDAALAHTQVREIPPMTYEHRVRTYEDEGVTTSDAQAVCDAEDLQLQRIRNAAPELLKALKKITDVALTSPQAVLSVIHDQKALIAKAEGRTF